MCICWVTGTNIVLWVNYTSKTNKQRNSEKEIRFVVTRCGRWGRENWMMAVKRYKLPVISARDVMYNMIKIISMAVCYI